MARKDVEQFNLRLNLNNPNHLKIYRTFQDLNAQSNVAVIRKPWEWQKRVYQNLELHLDAAIDKIDNLAKDVEIQKMEKKWDELYEQTHQERREAVQTQDLSMVSELEYQYGADAFEAACTKMDQTETLEIEVPAVPKTGKSR